MKLSEVILLAVALVVTVSSQIPQRNDTVGTFKPPTHTHWGKWKTPVFCNYGTFADAIIISREPPLDDGDDTAVNKIRLECRYVTCVYILCHILRLSTKFRSGFASSTNMAFHVQFENCNLEFKPKTNYPPNFLNRSFSVNL